MLKVLYAVDVIFKLVVLSAVGYVVFKTSVIAGAIATTAYVLTYVADYFIQKTEYKRQQDEMNEFMTKFTQKLGGGSC